MNGPLTATGVRCECRLYGAAGAAQVAGVFDSPCPARAMRWIRVAVRTLVSTLDEESAEPVYEWLMFGEAPAARALSRGEARTYSFGFEDSRVEFAARPVRYLLLAHRSGLPACSQMAEVPPTLSAVPGRGLALIRPAGQRVALRPGPCPDEGEFRA
ncbi:hypothetical protein [Streptomyces sp. NPDC004296]|uniref:hypothetical protein n=1 Tax=Streptomyces sp. NPDC004296 TaxID=3364697 RepID=UPI0036AEBCBB